MNMTTDIRDAFFDRIYELAANDPNVVFLSADADAFSLQKFRKDFPDRYINIGVAEQNMINVASGLSLCDKNVFVYAILPFVTMRCYEQIKFNLCGMNLPVTIVGVGAGYSFDFDGPSHHGVGDIGILRMLPEMTIYNPATPLCADNCAQAAYESSTPVCVRLDKGKMPEFYSLQMDYSKGFGMIKDGTDLCILATGSEVQRAAEIAALLADKGINTGVMDIYRIKPVDEALLVKTISSYPRIVTLEENSIVGGLGSIVAEIFADHSITKPLKRLALPDVQCFHYGSRQWLHEQYGFDIPTLLHNILLWLDGN